MYTNENKVCIYIYIFIHIYIFKYIYRYAQGGWCTASIVLLEAPGDLFFGVPVAELQANKKKKAVGFGGVDWQGAQLVLKMEVYWGPTRQFSFFLFQNARYSGIYIYIFIDVYSHDSSFPPPVGKSRLRQKLEACGRFAPHSVLGPNCQDCVASLANHAAAGQVRCKTKIIKVLRLGCLKEP